MKKHRIEDNVDDQWTNFKDIVWEVADGVLWKKVGNAARNIREKGLCLIEKRMNLYNNYLSDRSYENKRKAKKVVKTPKYELMRYEVEENCRRSGRCSQMAQW